MARTVNAVANAARRGEILAAAERLVYQKGYERLTIGDILAETGMSSGAFYHYFPSKPAVLEALIESMQETLEEALVAHIRDPQVGALVKLQQFLGAFDQWRSAHHDIIRAMLHTWYTDENAIVRDKIASAMLRRRAPLLAEIVRQGRAEGVFSTPYGELAGEIVQHLIQAMGDAQAMHVLALEREHDLAQCVDGIVATHAAYIDAIERVLGAHTGALARIDTNMVLAWLATFSTATRT